MNIIFSNRLKERRVACGISRQEMAKMLGISYDAYAKYELCSSNHREPNLDVLFKIVRILHTTSDYILGVAD